MDKVPDLGKTIKKLEFPNISAHLIVLRGGRFVLNCSTGVKTLADFYRAWPLLEYLRPAIHILGGEKDQEVLGIRLERGKHGGTKITYYQGLLENDREIADELFNNFDFPPKKVALQYLKGVLVLYRERDLWLWGPLQN